MTMPTLLDLWKSLWKQSLCSYAENKAYVDFQKVKPLGGLRTFPNEGLRTETSFFGKKTTP